MERPSCPIYNLTPPSGVRPRRAGDRHPERPPAQRHDGVRRRHRRALHVSGVDGLPQDPTLPCEWSKVGDSHLRPRTRTAWATRTASAGRPRAARPTLQEFRRRARPRCTSTTRKKEPDTRSGETPDAAGSLTATELEAGVAYDVYRWDSVGEAFSYRDAYKKASFTATSDTLTHRGHLRSRATARRTTASCARVEREDVRPRRVFRTKCGRAASRARTTEPGRGGPHVPVQPPHKRAQGSGLAAAARRRVHLPP